MKKSISVILAILMSFSCFSMISFAETTDSEHLTTVPEGYVGIYTKDDLDNIKLDLSGEYILMNDIVFTEEDYAVDGSFYNSGKGWSPIGTKDYPFTGNFDGNGYTIYNLTINNSKKDYQGLFGYVGNATIFDICLTNASITGDEYVGGICGYISSAYAISDCIVSGHIKGSHDVGGVCGRAQRINSSASTKTLFNKCINTAEVTASYDVGGICGYLYSYVYTNYNNVSTFYEAQINQCINIGNISGIRAGGIAGYSNYYDNMIENSYNTGSISGSNSGGIVGYNCSVKNSYSVGIPEEGSIVGTKKSTSDKISYCYYLVDVVDNLGYINGIGKSKDQMIKQTTYEGWDFDTVWTMDGREDYLYPELRNVSLVFPDELTHKHEYSSEITISATHLAEGVMTYTCTCGDTYTEVIAKTTEHTFSEEIIAESTCTAKGKKLFTCECGYSYSEEIAKTSHVNANGDYACDICGNNICSHICHRTGFVGFIWKILQFFWKLFGINPVCECGAYHY